MSSETTGQSLLENAYRLASPADSVAYYRDFAPLYDTTFAGQLGWAYPRAIAESYRAAAGPQDWPVADIGCGTGWVAQELRLDPDRIDGFDISPEMLAEAGGKRLYRRLTCLDLTGPLDGIHERYGAVVSAGTFTHGHLGPGPLAALLGIVRPGALFVIGVNEVHFAAAGFATVLEAEARAGRIGAVTPLPVLMYARPDHAHSGDRALILTFRAT